MGSEMCIKERIFFDQSEKNPPTFKKKKEGSVFSYSLDNLERLSDRKVSSFYFISGKTKRDLGFCGLFCYLNSPVLI